jgi:predicted nucleic acid-binding protein
LRFIDTNVFVRFLTRDDPQKADACAALLIRIRDGAEDAMTTEAVVAEVFYVLTGRVYATSSVKVAENLRVVLSLRGLRIEGKQAILGALDVIETYPTLDFEDALIVSRMNGAGISELYSFDRDFDRVPGITRLEPAATS